MQVSCVGLFYSFHIQLTRTHLGRVTRNRRQIDCAMGDFPVHYTRDARQSAGFNRRDAVGILGDLL